MEKKKMSFKKKFLIFSCLWIVIISSVLLYARFIGTKGIYIREYKLSNSSFVENFYGFKIVHISDIHYGRVTNAEELDELLKKINNLNPDLVFLTGDLVDKDIELTIEQKEEIINFLKNIKSTNGKFAVSGNHEMFFDYSLYQNLIENGGFVNLDNTYTKIYNSNNEYMLIAGLESEVKGTPDFTELDNFVTSLKADESLPKPVYKIILMHTPDTITKVKDYDFDLALAGHSHNGQIRLPFIGSVFSIEGSKKYDEPYYNVDGTDLYISGGIGTSTINLRLFNHPSFNFYRLTNK